MLHNRRKSSQRQRIAYDAARMLADGLCQDIRTARQKAAERSGIAGRSELPTEEEIEQALRAQQALFQNGRHSAVLSQLRQQAMAAMKTLARFNPYLVGPVLNGTAESYNKIQLHLFSETTEEVVLFLLDQNIPWRDGEKSLRLKGGKKRSYPVCSFRAGETEVELTLLPLEDLRRPFLGPLGDRLLQRASLNQLQELLKEEE